jgi:hypothetical protein
MKKMASWGDFVFSSLIVGGFGVLWGFTLYHDLVYQSEPVQTPPAVETVQVPPVNIVFTCDQQEYVYQIIPETGAVTGGLAF